MKPTKAKCPWRECIRNFSFYMNLSEQCGNRQAYGAFKHVIHVMKCMMPKVKAKRGKS